MCVSIFLSYHLMLRTWHEHPSSRPTFDGIVLELRRSLEEHGDLYASQLVRRHKHDSSLTVSPYQHADDLDAPPPELPYSDYRRPSGVPPPNWPVSRTAGYLYTTEEPPADPDNRQSRLSYRNYQVGSGIGNPIFEGTDGYVMPAESDGRVSAHHADGQPTIHADDGYLNSSQPPQSPPFYTKTRPSIYKRSDSPLAPIPVEGYVTAVPYPGRKSRKKNRPGSEPATSHAHEVHRIGRRHTGLGVHTDGYLAMNGGVH